MTVIQELELIEGKKNVRDRYISRTEVLERVKELSLLSYKETATTEMVAEYYGVPESTIRAVVFDHEEELLSDGYNVVKGDGLKVLKGKLLEATNLSSKIKYARQIAIFPRRAILRVGMLLRDSEVAKQIRTYLLNVEEISSTEQKREARKSSWTSEEEMTILNAVLTSVNNGGTLNEGLIKASKMINKKYSTVAGRWHYKVRNFADKDVLEKIRNNIGRSNKKEVITQPDYPSMELAYQIDKVYRENGKLKNEVESLRKMNKLMKEKYHKLKEEHRIVMNVIGSAMKAHTRDVLRREIYNGKR